MMMIYGMFVFELKTLPYQQLRHSLNWRHVKTTALTAQQNGSTSAQERRRSTLTGCFTLKLRAATYLLPFWQRRHTLGVRGL